MVPKIFSLSMTMTVLDYIESSGTPSVVSWWVGQTNFNYNESFVGPLLEVRGRCNSTDRSLSFGLISDAINDFLGLPSVLIYYL